MANDQLVDALHDRVGDALRSVVTYDPSTYEVRYLRPDVDDRYDTDARERIHRELVLQGLGRAYLEDLFDAGRLHCSMHHFEEALLLHFPVDEREGSLVGVDTDRDVRVVDVVARCREVFQVFAHYPDDRAAVVLGVE